MDYNPRVINAKTHLAKQLGLHTEVGGGEPFRGLASEKAKIDFGVGRTSNSSQEYIAMHIRTGDTYAIRGTVLIQCIFSDLSTYFNTPQLSMRSLDKLQRQSLSMRLPRGC